MGRMTDARLSESIVSGPAAIELANEVSVVINRALQRGMAADDATCVVASIAADYARMTYGDSYLASLAHVVLTRGDTPEPEDAAGRAALASEDET